MKKDLREIYWRRTGRLPRRRSTLAEKYRAKYGRAVECLAKDRDALLAFYDFPAEHWITCARPTHRKRVRDRAAQNRADERITVVNDSKADGVQAGRRRIKNLAAAQSTNQLPKVIAGVRFNDGIEVIHMPANHAA